MDEVITIKQLHEATGKLVRAAGKAGKPTMITGRGQPVAVLAPLEFLVAQNRQPRRTLPEYEALMRQHAHLPVSGDLDALRGCKRGLL
jgi:antitoxin (DNA-binding transcriptional repressor) of toxin-antitoxin stability system